MGQKRALYRVTYTIYCDLLCVINERTCCWDRLPLFSIFACSYLSDEFWLTEEIRVFGTFPPVFSVSSGERGDNTTNRRGCAQQTNGHHCRRSQGLGRLTLHALANYYTSLRGTCCCRVHFSRKQFGSSLLPAPSTPRQDTPPPASRPPVARNAAQGSAILACVRAAVACCLLVFFRRLALPCSPPPRPACCTTAHTGCV